MIPRLILVLLLAACFALAAAIIPSSELPGARRREADDMLTAFLGEGRRLFANHFFVKADVYLHSGYYPTIFDGVKLHSETNGPTPVAGGRGGEDRGDFLGRPKDWIDRFSRNFYVTVHTHLEDKAGGSGGGMEREILPWLQISASLDPHRVETYTVAAYWLRSHMGKVDEAEAFLREGRRENPDSYEILFELGRLVADQRKDDSRARNLLELALLKWRQQEADKSDPDLIGRGKIIGMLARIEERTGNFQKAISHLEDLKRGSPAAEMIQHQIDELRKKLP